jgi:hypothetical protein
LLQGVCNGTTTEITRERKTMKTYFIAGWSSFPGTNEQWHFWRVMNIDDKKLPHELITEVCEELENSEKNHSRAGLRGEVTITAFNQV